MALGKTVKQLLSEIDSQELSEWAAYDRRWPLPDHWRQTARLCRTIMCASGNYKPSDIPDEVVFVPQAVRPEQTQAEMMAEFAKLSMKPGQGM